MTQGRLDLFHALNFKVYANHKMIRSEYAYNKSLRQMLATIKEKLQPEKQWVCKGLQWTCERERLIATKAVSMRIIEFQYRLHANLTDGQRSFIHTIITDLFDDF